jgi:aromatic ring-opening dioxygenase catalytic subunit (LigB family)
MSAYFHFILQILTLYTFNELPQNLKLWFYKFNNNNELSN